MARDYRTVGDLSEEEYDDYKNHPENYEDVTENTHDLYRDTMHPDGEDD